MKSRVKVETMHETTYLRIELSVFGDALVADEFSAIIGIGPTRIGVKGAEIPPIVSPAIRSQAKRFYKDTFWDFSTERFESLFLDEISERFLDKFPTERLSALKQYLEGKGLTTRIFIVVEMGGETTPAINFNRRFLDFAYSIDAEIEIDLYDIRERPS